MRSRVPGEWRSGVARLIHGVVGGVLLLGLPALAGPAPVAALFTQRCRSCHTLGEGDKVGPDLLGVMERREEAWLTRFLASPGAMIDSGEPTVAALFQKFNGVRMPDQQLTAEQREQLFTYFRECTHQGACRPSAAERLASDATPEEIDRGRRLFEGREPLAKGGPACFGCHDVRGLGVAGGGTLARELTFSFARLGDRGMSPVLERLDLGLMRGLYAQAPLTEQEQYELKAFLADVSRDGTPPRADRDFFYLGVVGLLAALGFFGVVQGGRGGVPAGAGNPRGDT